jgi:hypothetical protein
MAVSSDAYRDRRIRLFRFCMLHSSILTMRCIISQPSNMDDYTLGRVTGNFARQNLNGWDCPRWSHRERGCVRGINATW